MMWFIRNFILITLLLLAVLDVDGQSCDNNAKLEVEINLFSFAESAVFGVYDWSTKSSNNDIKRTFQDADDWTTHKNNYCLPANRLHEIYVDSTSTDNRADGQITTKINGHQQFKTQFINDRFQSVLQYSDRESCLNSWTKFKLVIKFGDNPESITWDLKENGNAILSSFMTHEFEKDTYSDIFWRNELVVDQCLRGGDYEFIIRSSKNNGLSSVEQDGMFEIYTGADKIVSKTDNFGGQYSKSFSFEAAPEVFEGFCFSGENTVQVRSRGEIFMKNLQLGDEVRVAGNKEGEHYERIYSFGHRNEKTSHDFLRLLPSQLELTPDHMVFLEDGTVVPASVVNVGDRLSDGQTIHAIEKVSRTGVYAPFTSSGKLLVNGVTASSYVSFQGSSYLKIGNQVTPFSWFWIAHSFTFPHRLWCNSLFGKCNTEEYTVAGVSRWVDAPYQWTLWLLDQPPSILFGSSIPLVLMLTILALLDFASQNFGVVVCVITGTYLILQQKHFRIKAWCVKKE